MSASEKRISTSEKETALIAAEIGQKLRPGDILCLYGTLGAGKSVFARALIRTLCANNNLDVPSPTFTLVQTYETSDTIISHFDLYRIKDPEELYELGWEEALDGITIVEWPERLSALKPPKTLDIIISTIENDPNSRQIEIKDS
jgi:tRNA threonylcarbamoyl adenosine modification protein YjeE